MVTTMDVDVTFSCDDYSGWLQKIVQLRNEVIGSNVRKENALVHIPKLKELLTDAESPYELRLECCIVLGSIAKGTLRHVKVLYEHHVHHLLVQCLTTSTTSTPLPFMEACARALRSMVCAHNDAAHFVFEDDRCLCILIDLLHKSPSCQECALLIIAYACKTSEQQQQLLHKHNAIPNIVQTLSVRPYTVKIAALKCLAALSYENHQVSAAIVACNTSEGTLLERVMMMMRKNNTLDMQLNAAKCLVYLYRADAIDKSETKLINKVLSTLVEMCEADKVWMHRQQGAWHLAYLVEQDLSLQRTATISGQLLTTISDYFSYHINDFDAALLLEGYHGFSMATIIMGAEDSAKRLGVAKADDYTVAGVVGGGGGGEKLNRKESIKDVVAGEAAATGDIGEVVSTQSLASSSSLASSQAASSSSLQTSATTATTPATTTTITAMLTDDVDTCSEAKSGLDSKATQKVNFISEHDKRLQSYKQHLNNLLRISAFNLYAALAANNETIRKKILDSSSVVKYIKEGLSDPCPSVLNSTLKCLVSLTRSVRQLRTNLNDNDILNTIIEIFLATEDEATLSYTTALFANLLLEFSPCKKLVFKRDTSLEESDIKPPVVMKLMTLTNHHNHHIKLNAIWAIMNLCFDLYYDEKKLIKTCILDSNLLFDLIRSTTHPEVLQRALATIRNILSAPFSSSPSFSSLPSLFDAFLYLVDGVVASKGREIMECVVYVLEGDFSPHVKEQALCILTNMASGNESKNSIMDNNDILRKIMNYLIHDNENLELAAIDCIFNLICSQYDGYQERKEALKQLQLEKVLEQAVAMVTSPALETRLRYVLEELKFS